MHRILFLVLTCAVLLVAMGLEAQAVPTPDEVWSLGEYADTSVNTDRFRALSVTSTVSTTSPFPSGGVCVLDVVNLGSAEIQCGTNGTSPTTTAGTFVVPAGAAFRHKTRYPVTSLKLHATTGTVAVRVRW